MVRDIAEAAQRYAGVYPKEMPSSTPPPPRAAAIKFQLIHAAEFCVDDYEHVDQVR